MYIDILRDLVSFKSITPKSEGAIQYIEKLLIENGFKTEVKIFGQGEKAVTNLYAVRGDARPNICFAGHVDVVSPSDLSLWNSDPFILHEAGGVLCGRGTVDMKGAIACFLAAMLEFIKLNPDHTGSISFLITSDEEGDGLHGTQEMLKYLHRDSTHIIDFAIIGEPTSEVCVGDTIKIGRRGSINFKLALQGVSCHVAYPDKATNPVPVMIGFLNSLTNLELDNGGELFSQSNLEITSIDVNNPVTNVIPYEITTKFNIRFNNLHTADSLQMLIDQIAMEHFSRNNLKYQLDSFSSAESFVQVPEKFILKFANLVEKVQKIKPRFSTDGGTSDARFIRNYCPLVEIGLCSDEAHKINEHTTVTDLQSLYNVYYQCLKEFL